jgi:exo-beta-1,3-glucanase (GH17 family)
MQKFATNIILALLPFSCLQAAYADKIRGVNYDPVHSLAFAKAVGIDDCDGMGKAIEADLDKLAELQAFNNNEFKAINHVKTFFANFSSPDGKCTVNIADVVNDWNQKHANNPLVLSLGVYEFREGSDDCKYSSPNTWEICRTWTLGQVNAAIDAVNKYNIDGNKPLIDEVVVGNEDIGDGNPNVIQIRKDISSDIQTIKAKTNGKVKVGTAQTAGTVYDMLKSGKNADIWNVSDFIGTNEYPYWDGIEYGTVNAPDTQSPVKMAFDNYWNDPVNGLNHLNVTKKQLIESEEGWPSAGNSVNKAVPSADHEHDYFYYWFYRGYQNNDNSNDPYVPTSYYFALFNKLPGQGAESNWGIYSVDGNSSVVEGDHSKPLAQGHIVVPFINNTGNATNGFNAVTINACLEDWPNQKTCYPIEGFAGASRINANSKGAFMLDITGNTYKSLVVVYQPPSGNQWPRLCYVDANHLSKLNGQSVVTLQWQNDAGNVECNITY